MKHQFLVTTLTLMAWISCGERHRSSEVSDNTIALKKGGNAVIYSNSKTVWLRFCDKIKQKIDRECVAPDPYSMDLGQYRKGLGIAFQIDEDILDLPDVKTKISEVEQLVASGTLLEEDLFRANEYLARLKANYVRMGQVLDSDEVKIGFSKIISSLEEGNDLPLDEHIHASAEIALRPFSSALQSNSPPATDSSSPSFKAYPSFGVITRTLAGHHCWYDVMGLPRGGVHCYTVSAEKPYSINAQPVKAGCSGTYGDEWKVPHVAFFKTVRLGSDCRFPNCGWATNGTFNTIASDKHRIFFNGTTCIASARRGDPTGDIDKDGLINRDDACNRSSFEPVEITGSRRGCSASQQTDTEFFAQYDFNVD